METQEGRKKNKKNKIKSGREGGGGVDMKKQKLKR